MTKSTKSSGRPAHEPTDDDRARARLLFGLGWSVERVAAAIGITPPTFRRHYRSELRDRDFAKARLAAEHAEQVLEAARGGNVSAMRLMQMMLDRADPAPAPKPAHAEKSMGKNAELDRLARRPRGSWADILPTLPAGARGGDGDDDDVERE